MVLTPSRSRTYVEASAEAESDRPPPRGRTFARLKSFVMPQGRAKQARFSQVLSRKSRIHRVERATKTHDDEDFATREVDHRRKKKRRRVLHPEATGSGGRERACVSSPAAPWGASRFGRSARVLALSTPSLHLQSSVRRVCMRCARWCTL
mgnify:CR=1 FL=1